MLVLKGLVGLHRTVQLQLLQCYWLLHRLGLLWYELFACNSKWLHDTVTVTDIQTEDFCYWKEMIPNSIQATQHCFLFILPGMLKWESLRDHTSKSMIAKPIHQRRADGKEQDSAGIMRDHPWTSWYQRQINLHMFNAVLRGSLLLVAEHLSHWS